MLATSTLSMARQGMNGSNWLDRSREASDLLTRGCADEAILIFQEIARANPRVPDAHNNLAVSLKAVGRLKEAAVGYRRALKLQPNLNVARLNLARALRQLGQHEEALTAFASALRNTPDSEEVHLEIGAALLEMEFDRPSPAAREILLSFFQNPAKDLQPFAAPAIRLLLSNRRFQELVAAAEKAYPDGEPGRLLVPREIADPLLISVLTWTIVPFPEIEAWFTLARRQLLNLAQRGERIVTDSTLLWAMAAQCQATELAQYVTSTERCAAFRLSRALSEDDGDKIAIAGMFLPLAKVPAARDLVRKIVVQPGDRSPMRNVLLRTIINGDAEQEIETRIQSVTSIKEETSVAVREQYEANPYPRWLSVDREKSPLSLAERVAKRFPYLVTDCLNLVSPSILIAGCGTGRHAIGTAARHAGSHVLAVDLSRASLAVAERQATLLGQRNITFAQGDILRLNALSDRFDLIETSGVLHHLADPMAGWRILRGLIKPRGLMRIGLYSKHARSKWLSSRGEMIRGLDTDQTNALIREKRVGLIKNRSPGPASAVLRVVDFYSLSGCRDLLFHTHEMQFSLPDIATGLAALDLNFLGFENLKPSVTEHFKKRFSMPSAEQDLDCWDIYERENPDTFVSMYQFWCQATT